MTAHDLRVVVVVVWAAVAAIASSAEGTRLFAVANNFTGQRSLFELDPTTGASSFIADVPFRVWGDISGREGDVTGVYSVSRVPGQEFVNQISRIDIGSGTVSDLYALTAADLGFVGSDLELTGIAFDPLDSSLARISAAIIELPAATAILFDLNLDTGAVSGIQTLTPSSPTPGDLNYASDGTLYSILRNNPRRLATVDLSTGVLSEIGACSNCSITSIEFDPITGELFGVENSGALLRLSPATADTLEIIGGTGLLNRIQGLAFVVPEPATGCLLALGLVLLAARRRRHH